MGNRETPSTKKPFERGLSALSSQGFGLSDIFESFLEVTAIAFINANFTIPKERQEENEARYQTYVKRYGKHMDIFAQMLADLVELMQDANESKTDFLGDFYERFITHGENGQFFTPETIASFLSKMTVPKGANKILDPCSGSGRMLLAGVKEEPQAICVACDLDRRCCLMTLINFVLYGIRGEVYRANTLTAETHEARVSYPPAGVVHLKKEEVQNRRKTLPKVVPHIKEQIEKKKPIAQQQLRKQKLMQESLFVDTF